VARKGELLFSLAYLQAFRFAANSA